MVVFQLRLTTRARAVCQGDRGGCRTGGSSRRGQGRSRRKDLHALPGRSTSGPGKQQKSSLMATQAAVPGSRLTDQTLVGGAGNRQLAPGATNHGGAQRST
jgi:hypothetical protein